MLHKLTDQELELQFRAAVSNERLSLQIVIDHIREIDRRGMYLRRAKPSLYAYLVEEMKLSSSSAQRRIDAARLAHDLPEVVEKVGQGKLCLDQITAIQRGLRRKDVELSSRRELLEKVEAASSKEAEQIVAEHLGLPIVKRLTVHVQKDGSVRVSVTFPKEAWESLLRCKDLLAHKIPYGDLSDVIEELCDFYRKKKDPELQPSTAGPVAAPQGEKETYGPVPSYIRRFIFQRDKVCQYVDPVTGRRCESHYQLEIDHIRMRSRGGTNHPRNLRLVCRPHNQLLAREAAKRPPKPAVPSGRTPPGADPSR